MAIAYSIIASNTVATTTDTVTTGSFTPASGSLLVAIAPLLIPGHRSAAMTIADSAGLTWTSRVFREDPANPADYPTVVAIWTAPVTTGTSMTVTTDCNPTGSDGNGRQSLYIIEVTGHNTTTPVPQTFNAGASTTYNASYSGNFGSAPAASSLCLAAVSNSTERPNTSSKITTGTGWTQIAEFFDSAMYNTSQIQARTGSTSSAIVWNNINSTYAHSIGAIEIAVAGAGGVSATFGVTIDPVTVTANGDLILNGILAQTIPAVTLSANGNLGVAANNGAFLATIEAVTLASNADLIVRATLAQTIEPVTLAAESAHMVRTAAFGVTIGPVTLSATGSESLVPVTPPGTPYWGHGAPEKKEKQRKRPKAPPPPPRREGGHIPTKALRKAVRELLALEAAKEAGKRKKPKTLAREIVEEIPAKAIAGLAKKEAISFVARELRQELPQSFYSEQVIRDNEKLMRIVLLILTRLVALASLAQQAAEDEEEEELIALLLSAA